MLKKGSQIQQPMQQCSSTCLGLSEPAGGLYYVICEVEPMCSVLSSLDNMQEIKSMMRKWGLSIAGELTTQAF